MIKSALDDIVKGVSDIVFSVDLFMKHNYDNRLKKILLSHQKKYIYKNQSGKVDLSEIKRIVNFVCSIKDRHKISLLPVVIDLGRQIVIEDKLTYILLECICYNLVEKEKCNLCLYFRCPHTIYNEGIKTSYLKYIDGTKNGMSNFSSHFSFDIRGNHFRKIIRSEDFDGEQTARTVQNIDSFLKYCLIQDGYRERVSDIVGELIDNSLEHSKSDCLIDIDVTNDYEKDITGSSDELYCGVNIVVLNFSDTLLGNGVSRKLEQVKSVDITTTPINKRYLDVLEARKYHSDFWGENYSEDDFNMIASFQHKISCRLSSFSTGGTGLTQLIKGLEEESDAYKCYMLSGGRKINFIKNMLACGDDNWIGFNQECDFLTHIPSFECVQESGLYFPGTAYNLNFVMKREVN